MCEHGESECERVRASVERGVSECDRGVSECERGESEGCENGVFGGEECLSLKMEPRSSRHRSNPCAVLMGVKQEL